MGGKPAVITVQIPYARKRTFLNHGREEGYTGYVKTSSMENKEICNAYCV